ncbi:zinc-finger domain-containing protein [Salipaludibacillus sp. HK11]|uniref:zinc-finger domain-containing protein n=1 Tax=Salipaludibacillus sp. HK11 TaxID=3394320 RepID=UPI0039FC7B26
MLKDKEKRVKILKTVSYIHDNHCEGCQDPRKFKQETANKTGGTYALNVNNQYCSNVCPYGQKLRDAGRILEGHDGEKRIREKKRQPHISAYQTRINRGMKIKDIAMELNVSEPTLKRWRKEWGLP